jgi:hypothetical protein
LIGEIWEEGFKAGIRTSDTARQPQPNAKTKLWFSFQKEPCPGRIPAWNLLAYTTLFLLSAGGGKRARPFPF